MRVGLHGQQGRMPRKLPLRPGDPRPHTRVLLLFKRYWNAFGASACLLAYALSYIFHWPKEYSLAAATGVLIGTLIELKLGLEHGRWAKGTTTYASMRQARRDIVDMLVAQLSGRYSDDIIIVGTRLRSIVDLLREVREILETQKVRVPQRIRLYGIEPAFAETMVLPGDRPPAEQQLLNVQDMAFTTAALTDILRPSSWPANVQVSVAYYREIPSSYFFLIGRNDIVFGGVFWNAEKASLNGPGAPCWHQSREAPNFQELSDWLHNRVALMDASARHQAGD